MLMGAISFLTGILNLLFANAKGDDIGLVGYRSRRSVASLKNWKASNLLIGYLMMIEGILLFLLSIIYTINFWTSFGIYIALMIVDIVIAEIFLYFYSKK